MDQGIDGRQVRFAGATMVLVVAGVVIGMAHHPTRLDAASLGPVHGGLIALLLPLAWGTAVFAIGRGVTRPLVLIGLLAFAAAQVGHVTAATIDGFALPAFAARNLPGRREIMLLAFELNQAFAGLGILMTAVAYVSWGLDLICDDSGASRLTGAAGIASGFSSAALLASGRVGMDLQGASLLYALQFGWAALVGVQLMRGKLGRMGREQGATA